VVAALDLAAELGGHGHLAVADAEHGDAGIEDCLRRAGRGDKAQTAERKPHSNEVFADGLEELYGVDSFPTVVILDRGGNVVFRANGFDPETIEQELGEAVQQATAVTARAEKPEAPVAH